MKPAGHPDCGACPHQSEPARCLEEISGCLEAISGEQGPTADEIENAKLRRERDEHEARWGAEVGHANNWCAKSRVAEAQRDDALWWCAQATQSEREHRETLIRCRTAAQILIAEIGATGPENIEETARRAVAVIRLERGQKRADLLQDLAEVTVALRDLVASVTATKTRYTIVLRDLEAARAVLGGQP